MKWIQLVVIVVAVLIQVQASQAKEMKEWTMLVFMNGHDDALDLYTEPNMELMEKVGSNEDINIVVQVGSLQKPQSERVVINKGSREVLQKFPRVDMGDYRELNKFIAWTVENYPAKKYFINVWNHGAGWHDIKLQSRNPGNFEPMDVSIDSLTGNFISTEEMGLVMKNFANLIGHKVDLYGNDACLMAMAEIVAEVADSVSYFASSQENEPLSGWPYDKFLARLAANPTMNGGQLGTVLTEEYLKRYPDDFSNPQGTTFSTVDVGEFENLMESISNLRNELLGLGADQRVTVAGIASATHRFDGGSDYKDLYDFVLRLERSTLQMNKSILADLKTSFGRAIIKNVKSENEADAYGLSIWLPTYDEHYNKFITRYRNLEFNKKTQWDGLLDMFFTK